LENHLEPSSAERFPNQLVPVTKSLVSPNLEIRKEALDGFLKSDRMVGELVALEVIFKI
jgi:hypothetical protein